MRKRNFRLLLFLLLMFYSFQSVFLTINESEKPINNNIIPQNAYTTHDRIEINSESELSSFPDKTGSGTQSDPYVISGLEISTTGYGDIYIEYITTSYLVIRDCNLTSTIGVYLKDSANIVVESNLIISRDGLAYGIMVGQCSNITIRSNRIKYFDENIILMDTNYFVIDNNTITNCGEGIRCSGSYHGNVTNNYFSNCGIQSAYLCADTKFINNTITQSPLGVWLNGDYNEVINNSICCCDIGVKAKDNYYTIKNNTIHNCGIAIYNLDSQISTIQYNFLYFNGIGLKSENSYSNTITENYFCSNNLTITYIIDGYWYDSLYYYGNYYSDFQFQNPYSSYVNNTWSIRYKIYGNGGGLSYETNRDITYDRYAMVECPFNLPTIITVSYFNSTNSSELVFKDTEGNFTITWVGIDNYILNGTYWIYENETLLQKGVWISGNQVQYTINHLDGGVYSYRIIFFDSIGKWEVNIVSVRVIDTGNGNGLNINWTYTIIGIVIATLGALVIGFIVKTNNCEINDQSRLCKIRNRLEGL